MGFFNKLKNVLFEEEEVEIPVITKKSEKESKEVNEQRRSNNFEIGLNSDKELIDDSTYNDNITRFRNVKRDIEVSSLNYEDVKTQEISIEEQIQEKSSPFLSFDEDEFERLNSKIKDNEEKQEKVIKEKQKTRKKEEIKKDESRRIEVPKRFKPSPVISPVYGILDKNYKKEDIIEKTTDLMNDFEEVSIETVRKKAFGTLVDDIESTLGEDKPLIKKEIEDERSIDEILTDAIDETISLDEEIDIPIINNDNTQVEDLIEEELTEEVGTEEDIDENMSFISDDPILQDDKIELPSFETINKDSDEEYEKSILDKTDTIKMLDDIEDELDEVKANKELLEDTTETDLFNLIDSMYENREEDK